MGRWNYGGELELEWLQSNPDAFATRAITSGGTRWRRPLPGKGDGESSRSALEKGGSGKERESALDPGIKLSNGQDILWLVILQH